jgi:hypothetical protein
MRRLLGYVNSLIPALLMAASVTLLAAGLLSYGAPVVGARPVGQSSPIATPAPSNDAGPGDPGDLPTPAPTPVVSPSAPASASPGPTVSLSPGPTGGGSPSPSTDASPSPVPSPSSSPAPVAVATRIVIESQGIDLPIVSRDLRVPDQGPDRYPPCDVAVYHTAFQQPGQDGSTYIYAHARDGMFLPLLTAAERHDGASLIGDLVQVYADDNREYVYEITLVKRHAIDFSLADDVPPGVSQLVLQTSEGPAGTVPKLQILAEPIDVLTATPADAHPRAHPRACYGIP